MQASCLWREFLLIRARTWGDGDPLALAAGIPDFNEAFAANHVILFCVASGRALSVPRDLRVCWSGDDLGGVGERYGSGLVGELKGKRYHSSRSQAVARQFDVRRTQREKDRVVPLALVSVALVSAWPCRLSRISEMGPTMIVGPVFFRVTV